MIVIIDYGVGNLYSLASSLKYIGLACAVSSDAEVISGASRLILPGVGAFGDAIGKLRSSGLASAVKDYARSGRPLLGICLGMQLLFRRSFEFGEHEGLGLMEGEISPLSADLELLGARLKVPQMGWNELQILREECPLLKYTRPSEFVYYVHSYYAKGCGGSVAAGSEYGVFVPGVVQSGNVCGTQFHPEKSGEAGLRILKAFGEM